MSDRPTQRRGKRDWRMGVRLGSHASEAGTNYAQPVKSTPPAMRKTTVRETSTCLHAPGQVGFPPTMNADASAGFPRMAYQSATVAMDLCESEKFALVRLVGNTYRAHSANKTDIVQGAKVGYRPCCTHPSHVVLPPTYALGEFHHLKARGLSVGKFWVRGFSGFGSLSVRATFRFSPIRGIWRRLP